MQSESFIRFYVVILMGIFIISTLLSGYFMHFAHLLFVSIFVFILTLHIFLRRKKLKKMALEFWYALHQQELPTLCNDQTYKNLKKVQIQQLCNYLEIDFQNFQDLLSQRNLVIKDNTDSLEDIALYNSYDISKIASMLLAITIQTKSVENM